MLTATLTEYNSPNYSVSYDPKYDVLRLSNKSVTDFSYEDLTNNLLLMIDEDTYEVIGAQILDFAKDKKKTLQGIKNVEYVTLRKTLLNLLEIID